MWKVTKLLFTYLGILTFAVLLMFAMLVFASFIAYIIN